jgi:4-aminobutyrate aminotransferase
MIGVDFVTDRESRTPAPELRTKVEQNAFHYGLITLGCGESTIRIAPALGISREMADEALTIFETAISASEKEG